MGKVPLLYFIVLPPTMRLSVDLSGVCPLPLNSMDWSRNHNIQPRVHVLCQHQPPPPPMASCNAWGHETKKSCASDQVVPKTEKAIECVCFLLSQVLLGRSWRPGRDQRCHAGEGEEQLTETNNNSTFFF